MSAPASAGWRPTSSAEPMRSAHSLARSQTCRRARSATSPSRTGCPPTADRRGPRWVAPSDSPATARGAPPTRRGATSLPKTVGTFGKGDRRLTAFTASRGSIAGNMAQPALSCQSRLEISALEARSADEPGAADHSAASLLRPLALDAEEMQEVVEAAAQAEKLKRQRGGCASWRSLVAQADQEFAYSPGISSLLTFFWPRSLQLRRSRYLRKLHTCASSYSLRSLAICGASSRHGRRQRPWLHFAG